MQLQTKLTLIFSMSVWFALLISPVAYSLRCHILYVGFGTFICLSICKIVITGLQYYPLLGQGQRFPINDPNLQPHVSPRPGECRWHTLA